MQVLIDAFISVLYNCYDNEEREFLDYLKVHSSDSGNNTPLQEFNLDKLIELRRKLSYVDFSKIAAKALIASAKQIDRNVADSKRGAVLLCPHCNNQFEVE